jgi:hypothetical protein
MKTSAEVFQETVAALSHTEKRAIFPPKTMKNFVVRKSWYGRAQLITFTNKKGQTITYDHDIALDIMRPRLELMNAWAKYGYWSQSTDIPLVLRHRNLLGEDDQPEPEVEEVIVEDEVTAEVPVETEKEKKARKGREYRAKKKAEKACSVTEAASK